MPKYEKNEAKEWIKQNLTGDIPSMITCFKEDGEVDYEAMRYNFRHILEFGTEGYAVNAMAGEQSSLTKEEKKKILELAVEEGQRNKVPVMTSVVEGSLADVMERVRHAEDIGADAVWLEGPVGTNPSDESLYQWYKYVADRVNIGIAIFNKEMGPRYVARLAAECPNIISKKTVPPLICIELLQALKEFKTEITLFMPFHSAFPCVLSGLIPPELASFVNGDRYIYNSRTDQPATKCWELAKKGELKKAAELFYGEPLRSRIEYITAKFRRDNTPAQSSGIVDISLYKYWHELIGLRGGPCRLPYLPPSAVDKRQLKANLIRLEYIEK
ncbi:dihydrodipicolinate synthase family protein [Chloroflexota bacterium]